MAIRKALTTLSALAISCCSMGNAAFSVLAAEEGTPYTDAQLTAVVYTPDNMTPMDCRFYANMPSVEYVSLADFYKLWSGDSLSIEANEDGTYTVTTPLDKSFVLDTEQDTLTTADFEYLSNTLEDMNGDDKLSNIFLRVIEDETAEEELEAEEITLPLSDYGIDLQGDEDTVWFPVTTLCDIFNSTTHGPAFMAHTLFFCDNSAEILNIETLLYDTSLLGAYYAEYANGRPKDLCEYNYNELCFVFDLFYGYPGRAPLESVMMEKGLDGMLSETNDDTRLVKEHLLSENMLEYFAGLYELEMYLYDGGHTTVHAVPSMILGEAFGEIAAYLKPEHDYEGQTNFEMEEPLKQLSYYGVIEARNNALPEAEFILPFEDAIYVEDGDTAMFIFDSFMFDSDAWAAYYNDGAEMPQDLISEFYSCLVRADANPDIKNFVIDVAANSGGLVLIEGYLMSLIADDNSFSICDATGEYRVDECFDVDKNLDKAFDEKDDELSFDLNFGILCSNFSYSAGNIMPSDARDAGILVLGEQSGGGGCSTIFRMMPDGLFYQISSGTKFVNAKYESVDLGITPDIPLVQFTEEGTKDFSACYDFDVLSQAFAAFYAEEEPETPDTTTPAETTTTGETTTTTTTTTTTVSTDESAPVVTDVTTTTDVTETSAESGEAVVTETTVSDEAAATETTTTTVTATTSESEAAETTESGVLPQTGFSRYYAVIESVAFMTVLAGAALLIATRKKEND